MSNGRLLTIVAVLFIIMSTIGVVIGLATVAASLYYRPTFEVGGGGIGAVSADLAALLLVIVPFLVSAIVTNLLVAPGARRHGPAAIWCRRGHILLTILTFFWPAVALTVTQLLRDSATRQDLMVSAGGVMAVIGGVIALVAALHVAFGVLAIRLLRRSGMTRASGSL